MAGIAEIGILFLAALEMRPALGPSIIVLLTELSRIDLGAHRRSLPPFAPNDTARRMEHAVFAALRTLQIRNSRST
jgi:hypothetical protein